MDTGAIQTRALTHSTSPKIHGHGRNQKRSEKNAILRETPPTNQKPVQTRNGERNPCNSRGTMGKYV
eukprot:3447884-Lingulodinium_polyedra.AAC.1